MQSEFEDQYHIVERDHWWFVARRHFILQFLKTQPKNLKRLDIGCSSGLMLNELHAQGYLSENIFGIDISKKAIENCHTSGLTNTFVMDASELTFPDESFDLIVASDCIEHLKEDDKALAHWNKVLKPNGKALIFAPAFMSLWSPHDEANHHFRRYRCKELTEKIKNHDFRILNSGYWNFFMFLPVFILRFFSRFGKNHPASADLNMPPHFINKFLIFLLKLENKLLKYLRFPAGVSVFVLTQKK